MISNNYKNNNNIDIGNDSDANNEIWNITKNTMMTIFYYQPDNVKIKQTCSEYMFSCNSIYPHSCEGMFLQISVATITKFTDAKLISSN